MQGQISLIHIILEADLVAKAVVLILVLMSITSGSIILSKCVNFGSITKKNKVFYDILLSSTSVNNILDKTRNIPDNVSIRMLQAGAGEVNRKEINQASAYTKQSSKDRSLQAIIGIKNKYLERLEDGISIVGIIGSNAAFVGLFGMVWSMMNIFRQMSGVKQATISMMAPGIVEAFLITAVGLFVAISSMVSYELLMNKLDKITNQVNNNSLEIYSLLSRDVDNIE